MDTLTLVTALMITYVAQAAIFVVMALFIDAYKNIRYWAVGSVFLALNFIVIYLRSFGHYEHLCIEVSNLFSYAGMMSYYFGSRQFMGLKVNHLKNIPFFMAFMIIMTYLTFIYDTINARIVVYSVMMCTLLIMNVVVLIKHQKNSIKVSARIMAILFLLLGLFFLLRALYYLIFPANNDMFFTNGLMQNATFMLSLCMGILWTQAIILLVNQRLYGELNEKTSELETSNAEKDKFIAVMAHDLRGPLLTMGGIIDLMSEEDADLNEKQMHEMALAMKKSVHSTNMLVNNLLDWAKLQRGLSAVQLEQTTFGEIMSSVMPTILTQSDFKKINLVVEIPDGTPMFVDPRMMQSVFRNLLSNAIKFTPAKGMVVLSSIVSDEGKIQFSISDNGVGIEPKVLNSLFSFDTQSRRTGTEGETSTGLGLIICKEFIEKQGGKIWAESEIGKGSRFSFQIQ